VTVGLFCGDLGLVMYAVKIAVSFYTVQYEHIKRAAVGCAHVIFRIPSVCFCQKLAKSVDIGQINHKNKQF